MLPSPEASLCGILMSVISNWKELFKQEENKPYFKTLKEKVLEAYEKTKVTPPRELIFSAFKSVRFEDVKLVLLGQDPYPGEGVAVGLSFVSGKGTPKSLQNIYLELGCECDLRSWVKEGVLFLNSILTTEVGKSLSHREFGWETFTDEVIRKLSLRGGVCFLLLGNYAQSKAHLIDEHRNKIIMTSHPSPLSAHRGFLGSGCFLKVNEYLKSINKKEINFWCQKV